MIDKETMDIAITLLMSIVILGPIVYAAALPFMALHKYYWKR